MKNQFPPLKVWIIVGILLAIIQGVIIVRFQEGRTALVSKNIAFEKQIKLLKNTFADDSSKSKKVVVVGSSLVGYGIISTKNQTINLTSLWFSYDSIKQWVENKDLINQLVEIKPDLVCLQTEMAAIKFSTSIQDPLMNKVKGISTANKWFFGNKISLDTLSLKGHRRFVKDFDKMSFLISGMNKLKSKGIPVVILDIPRPVEIEKKIYTQSFKTKLNTILTKYKLSADVEHWSYNGDPLFFNKFKDAGHLNEDGRKVYTNWLMHKINKELISK